MATTLMCQVKTDKFKIVTYRIFACYNSLFSKVQFINNNNNNNNNNGQTEVDIYAV